MNASKELCTRSIIAAYRNLAVVRGDTSAVHIFELELGMMCKPTQPPGTSAIPPWMQGTMSMDFDSTIQALFNREEP